MTHGEIHLQPGVVMSRQPRRNRQQVRRNPVTTKLPVSPCKLANYMRKHGSGWRDLAAASLPPLPVASPRAAAALGGGSGGGGFAGGAANQSWDAFGLSGHHGHQHAKANNAEVTPVEVMLF